MRAVDVEGAVGEATLGVEVAGFAEDVVGGAVCCLAGLVGAVLGCFCFAHFVGCCWRGVFMGCGRRGRRLKWWCLYCGGYSSEGGGDPAPGWGLRRVEERVEVWNTVEVEGGEKVEE